MPKSQTTMQRTAQLEPGIPMIVRYPRSPVSRAIHSLPSGCLNLAVLEPMSAKPGVAPANANR